MEMPVVTTQPEEAAAAAWGEEMKMNAPSDEPEKRCRRQLLAVPIKVGTKVPHNLHARGNPGVLCPKFACSTPVKSYQSYSGTACPTASQIRANLQHRGLTITSPELQANLELTMLFAGHTEQRVSQGACIARAILHFHTPKTQQIL